MINIDELSSIEKLKETIGSSSWGHHKAKSNSNYVRRNPESTQSSVHRMSEINIPRTSWLEMTLDTCESSTLTTTTSAAHTTLTMKTKTHKQRHFISMHEMNTILDRKWEVTTRTNTNWIRLWIKKENQTYRCFYCDCWSHKFSEFHEWVMKWSMTDVAAETSCGIRKDIDSKRTWQYRKPTCASKKGSSAVRKWSVQLEGRQWTKMSDRYRSYCKSIFD